MRRYMNTLINTFSTTLDNFVETLCVKTVFNFLEVLLESVDKSTIFRV